MEKLKDYTIQYSGLKEGKHEFKFELNDSFFSLIENSLISKGRLNAEITLDKKSTILILDFYITGVVECTCDLCLEPFEEEIETEERLYIKFGEEYDEPSDEIVILPRDEYEVNVAQWLYEYTAVQLPIRTVHPSDKKGNPTCNPEMLKKIDEYRVSGAVTEAEPETDPRWNSLKKLIDNNQ